MALVGLVVTLAGFLVAVLSVGFTTATTVRLVIVLVGIAISLGGIIGMINPAYQKNAVWKR
jgi:predicted phage tail protein